MDRQQDLFATAPEKLTTNASNEKWSLYRAPKLLEPPPPPQDASERERALHVALAKAKQQLHELRTRLVRADCVAATWAEVPRSYAPGTDPSAVRVEFGALMRRILSADGDTSLKAAIAELARQRGGDVL